jgi:hypothetical protein
MIGFQCADGQSGSFGFIQVSDGKLQMNLLWNCSVRPARHSMVLHALHRHEDSGTFQCNESVQFEERFQIEKASIEIGESLWIGAVKGHRGQAGDGSHRPVLVDDGGLVTWLPSIWGAMYGNGLTR